MNTKIGDTLYGVELNGGVKQWEVWVDGDTISVQWGKLGGKIQTKLTTCLPKNIGRANETTAEQQALSEAQSKWDKQYKSKFYRPSIEEAKAMLTDGVMLSQKFNDASHKLPQMCYISRKLDGLRCKTVFESNDLPKFVSRGNDQYPVWAGLATELGIIHDVAGVEFLDGELYKHGLPLQKIVSAVRVFDAGTTPEIQYNIFDVPMLGQTFSQRVELLDKIAQVIKEHNLQHVVVVEHILDDKSKYKEYNQQFVAEGYEGVMFNDPHGQYAFQNKRPAAIQKYKEFEDSEALVIGCTEDKNGEGVLTYQWLNPQGNMVEFDCKMRGNHESRSYSNQSLLIGYWVNFRYQQLTVEGKPQFPVALSQRNCDSQGNPLD